MFFMGITAWFAVVLTLVTLNNALDYRANRLGLGLGYSPMNPIVRCIIKCSIRWNFHVLVSNLAVFCC